MQIVYSCKRGNKEDPDVLVSHLQSRKMKYAKDRDGTNTTDGNQLFPMILSENASIWTAVMVCSIQLLAHLSRVRASFLHFNSSLDCCCLCLVDSVRICNNLKIRKYRFYHSTFIGGSLLSVEYWSTFYRSFGSLRLFKGPWPTLFAVSVIQ